MAPATGKRATIYSAAPQPPTPTPKAYVHDRPARLVTEWQACHAERARIALRRPKDDWDAANDNEPVKAVWPLAKALLAEGNKELLKYAIAYRRIYDTAKSEALLGGAHPAPEMSLEQRYIHDNNESKAKGTRKLSAGHVDEPATRKMPVDPLMPSGNGSSVPKPWNGDAAVNDMIDAKRKLVRLQERLGHLTEPLEMAVVDGETLEAVGNAAGVANRAGAMGAGRALVHMGLIAVRDELGKLNRKDFRAGYNL